MDYANEILILTKKLFWITNYETDGSDKEFSQFTVKSCFILVKDLLNNHSNILETSSDEDKKVIYEKSIKEFNLLCKYYNDLYEYKKWPTIWDADKIMKMEDRVYL